MSINLDRAAVVHDNFITRTLNEDFPPLKSPTLPLDVGLNKAAFLELFEVQLASRHLDLISRKLREQGEGFYTIGSSGHEGNAAIAKAFRPSDMAFLHYRSSAFMLMRGKQKGQDQILDQCLSLVASKSCPISGGRHKVFGSLDLFVPPQTSTIASHLPKAFGAALSIGRAKAIRHSEGRLPQDSVILSSFGDASFNHSTLQGTLNAIAWVSNQGMPMPMVLICEDNGIGISVPTPNNWISDSMQNRFGFHYLSCDGRNLSDTYQCALEASQIARKRQQVVFLHFKTERLLGHAGSDIEFHYRSNKRIESAEGDDPLLHTAGTIRKLGWLSAQELVDTYQAMHEQVLEKAERAKKEPKLVLAADIMSTIIPPKLNKPQSPELNDEDWQRLLGRQYKSLCEPKNMASCINLALTEILEKYKTSLVFGEDVGKKGGVYRVTADLQSRFGPAKVFDTLLDEQSILGTAIGMAHNGFIPIPEIQFLAYTHNAADQLRGEASTLSFFSNGQYTNPMVCRIAALGYQKGFGGHFHNDNAIGFLREIPGVILACPSSPSEAALMLKECFRLAYQEQRVVVFLEPIALYMTKDHYQNGDNRFLDVYPQKDKMDYGSIGIKGEGKTAIISYGNGHYYSTQAQQELKTQDNVDVKLIDLRWIAPLNVDALIKTLAGIESVLIVDECRSRGSVSEEIVTVLVEAGLNIKIERLCAEDCFIPLGKAWTCLLPSTEQIIERIRNLQK